jgi:hypothetical protein
VLLGEGLDLSTCEASLGTAKRWSRSGWAWLGWGLDVSFMQVFLSCDSSHVAVTSEAGMKRSCGWDRTCNIVIWGGWQGKKKKKQQRMRMRVFLEVCGLLGWVLERN